MSDLPEIDSEESLKAWLGTRPHEDAVLVAHRAAMRVAPIWFAAMASDWARDDNLTAISILWPSLIPQFARQYPTLKSKSLAPAALANRIGGDPRGLANHAAGATRSAAMAVAIEGHSDALICATNAVVEASYAAPIGAVWDSVQIDVHALVNGKDPSGSTLWPAENPLASEWQKSQPILRNTPGGEFWIDWYQRTLGGRPQNWPLLRDVALIDDALWKQGGEALDSEIRRLVAEAQPDEGSALSRASPVEFDFDQYLQQMQIVGFSDDVAHLNDPGAVAAFVADVEELQEGLQDFLDYSADVARNSNQSLRTATVAGKLLNELARCEETRLIRARRLIMLGKTFADMALDDAERERLGPGLTNNLDSLVSLTRTIYRKHLAPSLERMRPLSALELGNADPDELIAVAERLAAMMEAADNTRLASLTPEALAVIGDFVDELRQQRGALADASSPERRAVLGKRFAEAYGAVAVAYARYVEKGKPYVVRAGKLTDWIIRQSKRWKDLNQIVDTIDNCSCLS